MMNKKYILILLTLFMLVGCEKSERISIPKDEYESLKSGFTNEKPKTLKINDRIYNIFLGSDGHEYYSIPIDGFYKYFHLGGCEACNNNKKDTPNE